MILEIRAGTGGHEAALWAKDLARMYTRFAESQSWQIGRLSATKDIRLQFTSSLSSLSQPFPLLKNEGGVHRVQRIPQTESKGRLHTSTATVVVLPKPAEKTSPPASPLPSLSPSFFKIETFRASGPGGQNVNKVETAVRIIHLPSGITVESQTERSQHRNREVALELLKHKLKAEAAKKLKMQENRQRREQIGTAERSEKIRTYNFPQNRITDHRLGKSWHNLQEVLNGRLLPILKS